MDSNSIILLVIRIMPSGDEVDVELPIGSKGAEIIEEILEANLAPRIDSEGYPYIYELIAKSTNVKIGDDKSLFELGIKNNEVIYFVPKMLSDGGGGFDGNLIYSIPSNLKIGINSICRIRISKTELKEILLKKGMDYNLKVDEIEINDLMIVTLIENSLKEHLIIKGLSTEEQIISDVYYSEWQYSLTPVRIGFTSVVLRVSMKDILKGFGERKKDVFLLNQDIEISRGQAKEDTKYIQDYKKLFNWTNEFKSEIYNHISKNDTGLALSKLINFFQNIDIELFNLIMILQSQWNEGKNKNLLNLISLNNWMIIQTRVNYGILELIKNIENGEMSAEDNIEIVNNIKTQLNDFEN